MEDLRCKPFVVVDLGSGSYLADNEGHEIYNEVPNPITGKYYGYAPPEGNINIMKLGAKKNDTSVSGVLVIYVKKIEGSSNRYISSFIPNATIVSRPRIDKSLNRLVRKDTKLVHASYCIESDEIRTLGELCSDSFVIMLKDYSVSMFRKQRFYKGTYPDLDCIIIDYLNSMLSKELDDDDYLFQQALQNQNNVSIPSIRHNATTQPELSEGNNGRQVKKKVCVSKAALSIAGYTCEANPEHRSFINRNGLTYMEGHHLIPCTPTNATRYWNQFGVNIDCIENIICLCPTCHRLLHYGNKEDKNTLLKELYSIRKDRFKEIGLNISLAELISLYN